MLQYQFFPRSIGVSVEIRAVIACFEKNITMIDSETKNLSSNEVLAVLQDDLEQLGFAVERSKKESDKIKVPVLFGLNNRIDKAFNADAVSNDGKIVIEVEAGRATENNQFLKDIFQACMMHDVEYLVIVVRNVYRGHKDFEIIHTFLETLYVSNRLKLPLFGILLIGY
jgi:hypothetical protein